MDAFIDSTTQATLANLLAQVNFLTKQLHNEQFHNVEFKTSDVQVYSTLCRYCNGPHMSIDCQMENPFAQDQPPNFHKDKI